MMWLLATVNPGMCFEATLLSECLFAPIFWAKKRPFPRMDPEMSLEIRLANEPLLSVRIYLLFETV
jgi:hypothetical protein